MKNRQVFGMFVSLATVLFAIATPDKIVPQVFPYLMFALVFGFILSLDWK